jgi:hypothetical protein
MPCQCHVPTEISIFQYVCCNVNGHCEGIYSSIRLRLFSHALILHKNDIIEYCMEHDMF